MEKVLRLDPSDVIAAVTDWLKKHHPEDIEGKFIEDIDMGGYELRFMSKILVQTKVPNIVKG